MSKVLEVCVDSLESALAAIEGGATRLELCANLLIGGTTPSVYLYEEIRKRSDIPIHVLIRPRFGDFLYSASEVTIMKKSIEDFVKAGAEGVVIGVLDVDGKLAVDAMRLLIDAAGTRKVVLHRAFDVAKSPFVVLEQAVELGITGILTSGQRNTALAGKELLIRFLEQADNRLEILIGGGVNASVIEVFRQESRAYAFHLSGKQAYPSKMRYRNPDVSMGFGSLDEYEYWYTNPALIRAAWKV